MKLWCALLSFSLLVTACGKDTINFNTPGVKKSTNPVTSNAQALYEALPGSELTVFMDPSDGSTQTQKQNETSFCRKIATAQTKAVFRFECWKSEMTNDESRSQYNLIDTVAYYVNVGEVVGSGTNEKINRGRDRLCQKITGSYPGAVSSYNCLGPL